MDLPRSKWNLVCSLWLPRFLLQVHRDVLGPKLLALKDNNHLGMLSRMMPPDRYFFEYLSYWCHVILLTCLNTSKQRLTCVKNSTARSASSLRLMILSFPKDSEWTKFRLTNRISWEKYRFIPWIILRQTILLKSFRLITFNSAFNIVVACFAVHCPWKLLSKSHSFKV